jgi:hypothetical protein
VDPAAQVALQRYLDAGCLILKARLGLAAAHVVFTRHAQHRMALRDIHDHEVLDVLALPVRFHRAGVHPGRYEVRSDAGRGPLNVVYERVAPRVVLIVTAYSGCD